MKFPFFRLQEAEPGGDAGSQDTTPVVPDSYAFDQVDGADVDAAIVTEVSEYAKANGLTQEQAQAHMARELSVRGSLAASVPETYEFAKIKVKNEAGQEVEQDVDPELAKEVSEFAKANGMTQEQAQAQMARELQLADEADAAQAKVVEDVKAKWLAEAKAVPELAGTNGQDFDKNVAISKRALEQFFPELAKDESTFAFLNHPQVLLGLHKIGNLISADGALVGGGGSDAPTDPAKIMYPGMS